MWLWIVLHSIASAEVPKKLPKDTIRGKELYDELCFQCHGANALADNSAAVTVKAPALAGRIDKDGYTDAVALIQEGRGLMPAYEMLIDKHDSKKILMYLSQLDPVTGENPEAEILDDEETEPQKNQKVEPLEQKVRPISTKKLNAQKVKQAQEKVEEE